MDICEKKFIEKKRGAAWTTEEFLSNKTPFWTAVLWHVASSLRKYKEKENDFKQLWDHPKIGKITSFTYRRYEVQKKWTSIVLPSMRVLSNISEYFVKETLQTMSMYKNKH